EEVQVKEPLPRKACSFERIYFSKGTDRDIYLERKKLGALLVPQIVEAIGGDFENTVFSFIPNTAEVAYFGMMEALEKECDKVKKDKLLNLGSNPDPKEIDKIL